MPTAATPFDVVVDETPASPASKRALLAEVRRLERELLDAHPHTIVATLQDMRFVTALTCAVYSELAASGATVTLVARDLPAYVCEGVRGVALEEDDPLVDVWSVVAVGDGFGVTFAATDRHGPYDVDLDREFEATRSRDAELARRALETLDPHLRG